MKCNITFRNIDHTEALDQKIRSKSQKLAKFFGPEVSIDWTCWTEKHGQFAEAKINHKSDHFMAKADSDDLYKTMDLVIDKLSGQITRKH